MCTIGAVLLNGKYVLFKNRQPVRPMNPDDCPKVLNKDVKMLIVSNDEGSYAGLNEHKIGIVCSFVRVLEGDHIAHARVFLNTIPELLNTKQLDETIDKIKSMHEQFTANFIVANSNQCFEIEYSPDKKIVKKCSAYIVKTNHFLHLPDSRTEKNLQSSFKRLSCAKELLKNVQSIDDIKKLMRDHESYPDYSICNHNEQSSSESAYILLLDKKEILHCSSAPCKGKYKMYEL